MAMLPKLKIKALVSFPANVFGGTGISIDKTAGNFTIDLNYSEFAFQGTLPTGSNVLVWDPVSNVYTLIPPSATGGISDAPTDGKTYGRKLAAWVDAWASPVLTGNPTAPTPSPGDNDTSVATTAFVTAALGGSSIPVPATAVPMIESGLGAVGTSLKYAREDHVHPAGGGGGGGASVLVADTAPTGATVNSLWFESDTGILYIYYADGTSTQWVAIAAGGIDVGAVRFDSAQTLTAPQQVQARQNVYAAPFDAMAYSGMQINGNADVIQEGSPLAIISSSNGVVRPCDGWFASCAQASGAINMQAYRNASAISGYQWDVRLAAGNSNFTAATVNDVVYLRQAIEGYRVARLGWGTAAASPLSYAFQLYASVAGTFFIRLFNSAVNRIYYKEHTVTAGYNWVVATIPGDTSGTWLADNNVGLYLDIVFGGKETSPAVPNAWGGSPAKAQTTGSTNFMATTSNIIAITGFIILPGVEVPSQARSPLIMRPYDQELITCQRYWYCTNAAFPKGAAVGAAAFIAISSTILAGSVKFGTRMRATPGMTLWSNGVQNTVRRTTDGASPTLTAPSIVAVADYVSVITASSGGLTPVGVTFDFDLQADARL